MCSLGDIRRWALFLVLSRVGVSLYLIIVGSRLSANIHLVQAFGQDVSLTGAFCIVFGVLGFVNSVFLNFGTKMHNKCVLFVSSILDIVLALSQVTAGLALYSATQPSYSLTDLKNCLIVSGEATTDLCRGIVTSERYARMELTWQSYHWLSLDSSKYYKSLADVQAQNLCCGFGTPIACVADYRPFPSSPDPEKYTYPLDYRCVCGEGVPEWYASSYYCQQNIDDTVYSPVIGGCKYDFPLGDCSSNAIEVGKSTGCAAIFEQSMMDKVVNDSIGITALSLFMVVCCFIALCMISRRPLLDVLPDHTENHIPKDPFADDKSLGVETVLARIAGNPTITHVTLAKHHQDGDTLSLLSLS